MDDLKLLEDELERIMIEESKEFELKRKNDELAKTMTVKKVIIRDGTIANGLVFSDGTFACHTSFTKIVPKTFAEMLMYGGNCFLIAFFLENMKYFCSNNILSPYGLAEHLTSKKCGVNFKSNTMLEGNDIQKIAQTLKVAITVKTVRTNGIPIDDVTYDFGRPLKHVSLDLMDFAGGGHYIVNM